LPLCVTQGQITFENLHFSYGGGNAVFENLSATLARLLLRLIEPQQGAKGVVFELRVALGLNPHASPVF